MRASNTKSPQPRTNTGKPHKLTHIGLSNKQPSAPKHKESAATVLIRYLKNPKTGELTRIERETKAFVHLDSHMIEAGVFPDTRDWGKHSHKIIVEEKWFGQITALLFTAIEGTVLQEASTPNGQETHIEKRRKDLIKARDVIAKEIKARKGFVFQSNKIKGFGEVMLQYLDIMIEELTPRNARKHKRDPYTKKILGLLVNKFIQAGQNQREAINAVQRIIEPFGPPLDEYTSKMLEKAYYEIRSKSSPKLSP